LGKVLSMPRLGRRHWTRVSWALRSATRRPPAAPGPFCLITAVLWFSDPLRICFGLTLTFGAFGLRISVLACGHHGLRGAVIAGCRIRDRKEHTSELQSRFDLVCRLLLEKKKLCDHT